MEAFLVSTGVVALAEMGDKTQLLSLVLAARFRRPLPIVLGILAATLLNHALAGAAGAWITALLGRDLMRWVPGLSFMAMGIWTLIPDKLDAAAAPLHGRGIFGATFVAFFLAEMGDKTQVATVVLAAEFSALSAVVAGTTLGMLLANVPVVLLGERLTSRIPLRLVRVLAALVFVVLGVAAIVLAAPLQIALHQPQFPPPACAGTMRHRSRAPTARPPVTAAVGPSKLRLKEATMNVAKASVLPLVLACALAGCGTTSQPVSQTQPVRQTQMTLATSIAVCEEVQRARDIPISCAVIRLRGRPTMVAEFVDERGLNTHIGAFAEYVADPFCNAANRQDREAYVVIALQHPRVGSVYSCETQRMSEWVALDSLSDS